MMIPHQNLKSMFDIIVIKKDLYRFYLFDLLTAHKFHQCHQNLQPNLRKHVDVFSRIVS